VDPASIQESLDLLSRLWSLFINVMRGDFRRKKLRIHHWQRQTTSLADEGVKYALGYAKDLFFDKGLHTTFNELVDAVAKLSPNVAVPPKVESPNH
jgi:hypothetical protein